MKITKKANNYYHICTNIDKRPVRFGLMKMPDQLWHLSKIISGFRFDYIKQFNSKSLAVDFVKAMQ